MALSVIINWLNTLIWETSLDSMPRWQAWLIQLLRILIATARDIGEGLPTLRAMGLVYTTLLSLDRDSFDRIIEQNPVVARGVYRVLTERLRNTLAQVAAG